MSQKKQSAQIMLRAYEVAVDNLKDYFVKRYFGSDAEVWWVAGDIGGVLYVNDQFLSVIDMVEYLRSHYTVTEFFAHRDYLAGMEYSPDYNIRSWKALRSVELA